MKTTNTIFKNFAKRIVMVIAVVMMAGSAWGRMGSPYTCTFETYLEESSNQVTTGDVTWNISRTTGKGSPTTTFGTAYSQSCIKLGSGSSNYYSAITLTTSDFSTYNITKVVLYIQSNAISTKTITVTQGATTIGSATTNFTANTWIDNLTYNTNSGSGGDLSIAITNDATAVNIHSIEVTYTGGSTYTVTFDKGSGNCNTTSLTEESVDGGVLLPSASPSAACATEGWTFAGWKQTSALTETTSIPVLYSAGSQYYPRSSETLYAVYKLGDIYTIDFEASDVATYSDWDFSYINTQDNTIRAHGGTYHGKTTHTSTSALVAISSKSKIASPKVIRFYISKTTSNNTSSTWKVQTSTDGSSWTDRATQEAAVDIKEGKWYEVTQNLSSYSDVYVRIWYGTSTAARAIDDVVLSCATYNSNPDCCAKLVALSKGTQTNATISSFSPSSVPTCSETASNRNVTITVAAATGYEFTSSARLTYSGDGTATYVSGPTGTGPYTFVYRFAQDDNGAGTFSVTSATPKTYTITYKDQGEGDFTGTQAGAPTTHTYGTATTLKIPTKFGHTFGGWYTASDCLSGAVGDASSAELGATDYTANIILYAKWTEKAVTNYRTNCGYSITYECNSASSGCPEDAEHAFYLPDPLPSAPTKSGCEFLGWYTDEELTIEAVAGATLSDDVTLYAKWCTSITTVSGKISVGSINETGGNASWSWSGATTGISKNILKVYNTSDVLVKTIDNISASATSQSITELTPCTEYYATLTTVASSGYCEGEEQGKSDNFTTNGWAVHYSSEDDEMALLSNVTKVTGASQACLSENYVATFTANTGYDLPSTIIVYIAGVEVDVDDDYTWSISDGVGTLTVYTSELSVEIGVRIIGEAKTYTASNNLDKNGGDAHGQYTATYDATTIAINTTPTRTGYTVEGYYKEAECTNKVAAADGTLQADQTYTDGSGKWVYTSAPTLYTNWTANIITITWNPNGAGASVTPTSSSYTYDGSTVDLPTPTRSLYAFDGWYTEASGGTQITEVGTTNKPTEDVEYFAHWRALTFEVKDQVGTGTADIHLTSTNGATVYATSGCGNLITIKATNLDAISNLGGGTANKQNIQIKYLDANNGDAEVAKASSPFRLCNDGSSNYNVADGSNIDLNGLTDYSQTYSISYTPSGYGKVDHYKLQLRLQNNNTEAMTITFDLYGRALPEEFVVVAKYADDGKWYALPNTLATSSGTSVTPVEITVDNTTTPTVAKYASTDIVYRAVDRYKNSPNTQFTSIRLSSDGSNHLQAGTSDYSLWLNTSGNNVMQNWYLKSADFGAYSVKSDPANSVDKVLGFYTSSGIKMGFHTSAPKGHDIYFLPIENKYTEIAATVSEWGQHSVIVEPETRSDLSGVASATMNIGTEDPTAATTTAINAVMGTAKRVKVADVGSDLDIGVIANEGKSLYIHWKNSGGTEIGVSQITIPTVIAASNDMKSIASTKAAWAAKSEVYVLPGVTLDANAGSFTGDGALSVSNLHLYPGATLKVSTGTFNATTLRMHNGWTRAGTKKYDVARVYIADDAALTKTTASMDYDIYELSEGKHFYPLAVPFPVAVSAIDYADTWLAGYSTYGMNGQYVIKEYNGARRAEVGPDQENNWTPVASDATLSPGKGYIMTAIPVYGEAIIRIPLTYDNGWTSDGEKATYDDVTKNVISVTAHVKAEGETKNANKGWNLLGVPFMSCYATGTDMGTEDVVMQGKFDFETGEWKEDDVRYVNVPLHDFSEYVQVDMEDDDPVTVLRPGWCFFVQIGTTGSLTFLTEDQAQISTLPIYAPKRTAEMPTVKTGIILSDGEKSDKTTLLISDKYNGAEYEINADLEKMFGSGYTLATYSLSGETRLAFNAMSKTDAQQVIPIGYRAPADGEYTFSLNPTYADAPFERVDLIDYLTGSLTNLKTASYTFTTERTQNDGRFAINVVMATDVTTDIENGANGENGANSVQKVIINDHMYIIRGGQMYDATGKQVREINK